MKELFTLVGEKR